MGGSVGREVRCLGGGKGSALAVGVWVRGRKRECGIPFGEEEAGERPRKGEEGLGLVNTSKEYRIGEDVKGNEMSVGAETIMKGPPTIRNKEEVTFSPLE